MLADNVAEADADDSFVLGPAVINTHILGPAVLQTHTY
jgi:hypothetical protein